MSAPSSIAGETRFLAKYPQDLLGETETGFLSTTSNFFIERNFTMPGGGDDKMKPFVTTDYTDFTDLSQRMPSADCTDGISFICSIRRRHPLTKRPVRLLGEFGRKESE